MIDEIQIPRELLNWRFGHEITTEHRQAVAKWLVRQGGYRAELADATEKTCLTDPDERFVEVLMPFIGTMSSMDMRTFLREFPTAAKSGDDGLVLEIFMRMRFPREGEPL